MNNKQTIDMLHNLLNSNHDGANESAIQDLLTTNPELINGADAFGKTVLTTLLEGVTDNGMELFKRNAMLLIRRGAGARVISKKSELTVLHVLAKSNQTSRHDAEIIELLQLQAGDPFLDGQGRDITQYLCGYLRNYVKDYLHTLMLLARNNVSKERVLNTLLTTSEDTCAEIEELLSSNPEQICVDEKGTIASPLAALFTRIQYLPWDIFKKKAMTLARVGVDVYTLVSGYSLIGQLISRNKQGCNDAEIVELLKIQHSNNKLKCYVVNNLKQSAIIYALDQHIECSNKIRKNKEGYRHGFAHSDNIALNENLKDLEHTIKLLAHQGVDPMVSASKGQNLWQYLFRNNTNGQFNSEIEALLQANPSLAGEEGKDVAQLLLDLYLTFQLKDDCFKVLFTLLFNSGVNMTIPGFTECLNSELLAALLEKYPSLSRINNKHGRSPLHSKLLTGRCSLEEFDQWIRWGSDIHTRDKDGKGLLHHRMHIEQSVIDKLISLGLDVTAKSNTQTTILHERVQNDNAVTDIPFFESLLEKGVDIHALDDNGDTALHTCVASCYSWAYNERQPLIEWFIAKGAKLEQKNKRGFSPLEYELKITYPHNDIFAGKLIQKYIEIQNNPLLNAIVAMRNYGDQLKLANEPKGDYICSLAAELMNDAVLFDLNKPKDVAAFKQKFRKTLHQYDEKMSQYRVNWETIRNNILIALTVVGIVAIAGQLIYSKATTGRALFFGQQAKTSSEKLVAAIDSSVMALLP